MEQIEWMSLKIQFELFDWISDQCSEKLSQIIIVKNYCLILGMRICRDLAIFTAPGRQK